MGFTAKAKDKLLHSRGFFMYVRSTIASQIASWVDMGTSFVLFAFCNLLPWLATATGAVVGGVVNCCINYKFTFRASGCSVKAVAVKYAMVWIGSLLLNTLGTQGFYWLLEHTDVLKVIGATPDGYFAIARLSVSLVVSIFWNYLWQKNFVYVDRKIDPQLEKLLETAAEVIFFKRLRNKYPEGKNGGNTAR